MEILKKYKTFLIIVVILIVGFVVYNAFFVGEGETDVLTSTPTTESQETAVGGGIVDVLLELREINLQETVFSSASFKALNDFSFPLVSQPKGRTNPFAPFGPGDSVTLPATTTSN